MTPVSAQRVAVFGEAHSSNLGDGVIYDCISYLFGKHGVTTIPVDLSGRSESVSVDGTQTEINEPSALRKLVKKPFQSNRQLGRAHAVLDWYVLKRNRQVRQWSNTILSADAVVIGGGQILTDRFFRFPPRIYEVARLAKLHGKPLAIFGCGSDQRWGYLAAKLYAKVLQQAVYVSARDQNSASYLSEYVDSDVSVDVHPDPAFVVGALSPQLVGLVQNDVLGVNLQPANDFRRNVPSLSALTDNQYFEFWAKVLLGASNSGRQVRLLTNGSWDDYSTARKVIAHLHNKGVAIELEPRPVCVNELVEQISKLSSMVSTRMHAGIVARGLGKSVAPISWDPKVSAVWQQVGGLKYVLPAETLLSQDPWPIIEKILADQSADSFDMTKNIASIETAARSCLCAIGFDG
jgi:polysaccharide pyruvyl transferase WcaK-like protein